MIEVIIGLVIMAVILVCFYSTENKRHNGICSKCKWFDDYIGCCTKYGKVTGSGHSCHNFEEIEKTDEKSQ